MCTDDTAPAHLHQPGSQVLHDFEPRVLFDLEPVDAVTVTTLMDNVTDIFMPDQGPAHRGPIGVGGRQPAATMEGGDAPVALLAEHGFSILVTWTKDSTQHQVLFDAGTTPTGWSRTCAAWRSTPRASRPLSAATATSTTPLGWTA